jgi:hypothetical protein
MTVDDFLNSIPDKIEIDTNNIKDTLSELIVKKEKQLASDLSKRFNILLSQAIEDVIIEFLNDKFKKDNEFISHLLHEAFPDIDDRIKNFVISELSSEKISNIVFKRTLHKFLDDTTIREDIYKKIIDTFSKDEIARLVYGFKVEYCMNENING